MSINITKKDMSFYRGDDISFDVVFRDPTDNNTPLDITGWVVSFTIKKSNSDPDAKAVVQEDFSSFTAPTTGTASIFVSHTETASLNGGYFYDIQAKRADNIVFTVISGSILFVEDTTRRVPS
jgi:hypothetical protein